MVTRKPAPIPTEEPLEIEEPDLEDASEPEARPATAAEERGVKAEIEREEVEVGEGVDVVQVRVSANSWWCPEDDTSMPHTMKECPKCGFIRP
jgi:hypothetical protein